ncbi:RHS repeat protein [Pseudomonas aeruginosa]|nr:RHS repeat protein [Pseudomonas aeruginosa]
MRKDMTMSDERTISPSKPQLTQLVFSGLALSLLMATGVATAQVQIGTDQRLSPPSDQSVLSNGVDPRTGEFVLQSTDLSIGSGSFPSRLDLVRVQSSKRPGVQFNLEGRAVCSGCGPYTINDSKPPVNFKPSLWPAVDIVLLGATYRFIRQADGTLVTNKADGATLERDAADQRLLFRNRDGVTAYFDFSSEFTCGYSSADNSSFGGTNAFTKAICQQVRYIEMPNGESLSYRYVTRTSTNYNDYPLAKLAEVVNSRGYGIRFAFDSPIDPTLVSSASGFRASCVELDTVLCGTGDLPVVQYTYDRWSANGLPPHQGRLRSVVDVSGGTTEYEYEFLAGPNANTFRIVSERRPSNPSLKVYVNTYDGDRVVKQSDAGGNATQYAYGSTDANAASETRVTDPLGGVTTYRYAAGNPYPIAVVDANGATTEYTFDTTLRLTSVKSPEGDLVENRLDARGNLVERIHRAKPGSGLGDMVETATFPACDANNFRICNKPTATKDTRGGTREAHYDPAHGGLTFQLSPPDAAGARAGSALRYATFAAAAGTNAPTVAGVPDIPQAVIALPIAEDRCLEGQAAGSATLACSDQGRVTTQYEYQASTAEARSSFELRRTVQDLGGAALASESFYDQVGNVTAVEGPRGAADLTVHVYDKARRLLSTTFPAVGGVTAKIQNTFDADGRQISQAHSQGANWVSRTVAYDARGLIASSTGVDGSPVIYAYDAAGRQIESRQDVDGTTRVTKTSFDAGGRPLVTTLAAGSPVEQAYSTVQYSANGQITSQTDAAGRAITFCYDGFDRLLEQRYPAADGSVVTPLCSAVAAGSPLPAGVTRESYTYAATGDLASATLRDGNTLRYTFDPAGQLTYKEVPGAERSVSYTYDLLGRRTAANLPGNNAALSVTWAYDKLGRVISSTGAYGQTVSYSRDAALTWSQMRWPDGFTAQYNFDVRGRISGVAEAGGAALVNFEYDEMSRRSAATYGNGNTRSTYAFDAQQRLASIQHDLAGADQDIGYGYTYNQAGQIRTRTVSNPAFGMADAEIVEKKYASAAGAAGANALNQYDRVSPDDRTLTYDGQGNLIKDFGVAGVSDYTFDAEGRLLMAKGTQLAYDAIGRLVAITREGWASRLVYDGQELIAEVDTNTGSTVRRTVHGPNINEPMVAYQGGEKVWLYADERGSIIAGANSSGAFTNATRYDIWGRPQGELGRFGYAGHIWLGGPDIYHMGARAYSPELGRFIQPDPAGLAGGMNLYAYADNDPVNLYDPFGLNSAPTAGRQVPTLPPVYALPPESSASLYVPGSQSNLSYTGINSSLIDGIRTGMDIAGMAPLSELFGAALQLSRAEYGNAALSVAGIVPVSGSAASIGKIAAKEGKFVYRGLAKGEAIAAGLSARAPGAGNSVVSHVAGKRSTQWISTTKDINTALEKYGQHGVVRVDLNRVGSEVLDVSGGIPRGGRMSNWARRDQEVLIRDFIPPEAIMRVK